MVGTNELRSLVLFAAFVAACGNEDESNGNGMAGSSGSAGTVASGGAAGSAGGTTGTGGSAGGGTSGAGGAGAGPPCTVPPAPTLQNITQKELLHASTNVSALRIVSGTLYFIDNGQLVRRRPGSTSTEVVTRLVGGSRAIALWLNESHVFFHENDQVRRAPLDGTDTVAELVLDGLRLGSDNVMAVDATRLYFFDRAASTISAVPVSGGAREVVVQDANNRELQIHAGFLYYFRSGSFDDFVVRKLIGGATEEQLAELAYPESIWTDGAILNVGNDDGVHRMVLGAGGQPELIVNSPPGLIGGAAIEEIVERNGRVYWVSDVPSAGWVNASGTACGSIARLSNPFHEFEVGDTDLFAVNQEGIYKIPLPN